MLARHIYGVDVIHDADEPIHDSPETIANGHRPELIGRHGFTSLRNRLETMDYIPDNLRRQLLKKQHSRLAFRLELHKGVLKINAW